MAFSYHLLIRRGGNGHAYWVVNLVDRVLVVFGEPGDIRYRTRSTLEPGARVAPGSWPDLELDIASVFFGRGRKRPEEAGRGR